MKFGNFTKLLGLLVILVTIVVLIGGYFNLIPVAASFLGTNKVKDLNIRFTDKTVTELAKKSQIKSALTPLDTAVAETDQIELKPTYSGAKDMNVTLSSEDMTAWIRDRGWPYYPIKDGQIKIHQDGTIEASAIVRTDRIGPWITATGGNAAIVDLVRQKLPIPFKDMPVYIRGNLTVINNKVDLSVQKLDLGRLPVPNSMIDKYTVQVETFAEERMHFATGLDVKELKFSEGKMHFTGTVPQNEFLVITK